MLLDSSCIKLQCSALSLVSRLNLGRLIEGDEDGVILEEKGEPKSLVSNVEGGVEVDWSSLVTSEDERSMLGKSTRPIFSYCSMQGTCHDFFLPRCFK